MTTKNLPKSFNNKINGQRLPPIPVTNEQQSTQPSPSTTTTNHVEMPSSILKKSKPLTNDLTTNNCTLPLDDDDPETSRVIFQKSQADVLLLLDTYPPKTWTVPKCLKSSCGEHALDQNRKLNPLFDIPVTADTQNDDPLPAFPSPISDRISSSRYCRRSVSSACSRRSSIIFQRHTGIPVDLTQIQRENTFDTVCESHTGTFRPTLTPLPPISTDPAVDLAKSLLLPTTVQQPSISPPLIAAEESPTIQEKKQKFTRHLLSKSLHREPTATTSTEKSMHSPPTANKASLTKLNPVTRLQKSTAENNRRTKSIERHHTVAPIINKPSATANNVSTHANHQQRLGKFSLDIFQPQSKSNIVNHVTNKKSSMLNNRTKPSSNIPAAKVKFNISIPNQEDIASNNDVIPPSSTTASVEVINQIESSIATEEVTLPSSTDVESSMLPTEPIKADIPTEHKRHVSSRTSAYYSRQCSHPVPKPLTLEGEKVVDPDYPQTTTRPTSSAIMNRERRESLKGQPLITELFEESFIEKENPVAKVESTMSSRVPIVKVKKPRRNLTKNSKPKKPMLISKPKKTIEKVVDKIETKSQSTNTETAQESEIRENEIIIGGTDWVVTVKPQVMNNEESVLSQLFDAPTVDDEDIPSCHSPTDELDISQTTAMADVSELERQPSSESLQAVEISPVLAQVIEHPPEPVYPTPPPQPPKSNESTLMNSDIRTVFETVQDSIRKDASLRSLPLESNEQEAATTKPPILSSASSSSSSLSTINGTPLVNTKTLPFQPSVSTTLTYNDSDTNHSIRPALRVVNDSLNSRGSETIDSTSSYEEFNTASLCTENDCDEVYRTARKGRQVGRGAFGIVWSYLTITGRMIAVKEIELDEGDSERVRNDYESVREEINILRALNHPYVVKFLGIALENTRCIKIYMEYLPNGTIENLLTAFGPFHNDVLKKYTRQLVEGVAYLHQNGVVHRDIKGKNIMLDVDGNIKLIDFGCAKRLKKNQNTHSMRQILKSMKGTANWMAPEVIAETGHGKKADIWSIGCTLCEMATGKPPWSSEHNHLAVLLIIANGTKPPADLPNTCPIAAQEFFRLCLTRDPVARPSAKDLLNHTFLAP